MKKIFSLILVIFCVSTFTSCSYMGIWADNDEKIADKTFNEIISAVRSKDASKIVEMFPNVIKNEDNLSQSALTFVNYIHGEIISFSSAAEAGVGADYRTESGKTRKEIQSSFCINTTESIYFIAIKECIKDEFDNNVGVISIYIIEADNWTEDYVYRGDGKWTIGINIVD